MTQKTIEDYQHRDAWVQPPDYQPGHYYVSIQRGVSNATVDTRLLVGPFTSHQKALDLVDRVRVKACELDPRGHWYAYGTARLPLDTYPVPQGSLNQYFID